MQTTTMEKLQQKLESLILENEGDRYDILNDIRELLIPLIESLEIISEPSAAYNRDPLTHANNVIEKCSNIAKISLDEFLTS